MTVLLEVSEATFTGNGVTLVFPFKFMVPDDYDMKVFVGGIRQTLGIDYTMSNSYTEQGGSVVFTEAPANGVTVYLKRDMENTQELDLIPYDRFPAESVEKALDRIVLMIQENTNLLANIGSGKVWMAPAPPPLEERLEYTFWFNTCDGSLYIWYVDVDSAQYIGVGAIGGGNIISESLTLHVPSSYDTINDAMDAIRHSVIVGGAEVTIQVASGTYQYDAAIYLGDHPDGSNIRLKGAGVGSTIIDFTTAGSHGFVVNTGAFGLISDMTVTASSTTVKGQFDNYALYVNNSGDCNWAHMAVTGNWENGIGVRFSANGYAKDVSITNAWRYNVRCAGSSTCIIEGCTLINDANCDANCYVNATSNLVFATTGTAIEGGPKGVSGNGSSMTGCNAELTISECDTGIWLDGCTVGEWQTVTFLNGVTTEFYPPLNYALFHTSVSRNTGVVTGTFF